ncbi:MAG: S-layer homology domain-containing protein [Clostridia bacterium]|nr:S-layer homology domain-containing protein [Clostridia bacterium]
MKNLKKVLALVMACAMLFTMSSFAFTDVAEDASYLEAVTMLSKLGIINGYEDGTFLPDNTITRAEAAKVLVCALNAAEQAEGMVADEIFTDVPASHWAAGYVNYASNFGIIAGRGNGIFDPEAPVTYEEIVKMVVAMLGYTPVANVKGGYPTGYLYVANNMLKITKGATGVTGDAAKRWVVARLLFNSLEAKIMEQETWSASDPEYVQGDQTLLKDYLEVTKLEGVVTSTFYATFEDRDDQEVEITTTVIDGYTAKNFDDKDSEYEFTTEPGEAIEFEANGTGAENYFGYTITAYVKGFEEDDELVAIAPKGNKNSTLEIAFDEIEAGSWKSNKSNYYTFEYYEDLEDEDPVVAKVLKNNDDDQDDALYFVNGVYDEDGDVDINDFASDIDATYGEDCTDDGIIRLLDNDGNGVYDFVFIETVTAEVAVKSINEKSYKVTGKAGTDSVTLDPEDEDYYTVLYKDGAVATFEDIAEDDILSIVELYGGKVLKVYISSETVEGRVTSTTNNYKIAGNIYSKSNQYTDTIAKGDEGTFFLNYNGKIAYSEAEKVTGGNYAFVLDVNSREPIFGTPVYTVLFMNEKGEWVQAELADKVSFYAWDADEEDFVKTSIELEDGLAGLSDATDSWFTVDEDADEDYDVLALGDVADYRVVKYSLNSAGEISSITIPKNDLEEDKVDEENFSMAGALEEDEYDANRNRFAGVTGKGGVAESTVVFTTEVDLVDVQKKKEVSLASASLFKDEDIYTGLAFDCVDKTYGCLVITGSDSDIAEDAALLVVKDIYEEENDEEEVYLVITGYMNGEEVTLETVADTDIESAFDVEYLVEGYADFFDNYTEDMYLNGAILEVAQDDAGLVTDIKVVYVDANLNDEFDGGYIFTEEGYDAEEEEGVAYVYGWLTDEELDGNYTFFGENELNVKGARIVNVDLTRKSAKFSVEDSIEGFLDSFITDDEGEIGADEIATMVEKETEVCFAVAKVLDGDVLDIVVYTVVFEVEA